MSYTKGVETKRKILKVAQELFYEVGYLAATTRQISERAEANLGLMKYYFGSKLAIAQEVYIQIRAKFDALVDKGDLREDSPDMFLFSSALELYLCLESAEYGRFYYELSGEAKMRRAIEQRIADVLCKYSGDAAAREGDHYIMLACISIAAIKPALVSYACGCPPEQRVKTEEYLRYYLRQQLHFLGEPDERAEFFVRLLRRYYIAAAKNFTPVLVKVE